MGYFLTEKEHYRFWKVTSGWKGYIYNNDIYGFKST